MAEVYTGGDRSQQALLQSILDRLHELEKPGASDVQRVVVKVVEAKQTAETAQTTAVDAQEQTVRLQDSIAQPGVNKFDTAPIAAQNIAGYYTEDLTGYSWLTGGIRLQTPESTNVGVRVYTLDRFTVRPGDVLSASVVLTFDNPAVAGFGWSFFNADGESIPSSASSIATENGLMQSQYKVPNGAVSLRMNLFAYVPTGYAVTRTWVEFRNPYVGILVGSDGLAKEAVKRVNIAPGAVGQTELDPSISFGVADDSVTEPKLSPEVRSKLNNGATVPTAIATMTTDQPLQAGVVASNVLRFDTNEYVTSAPIHSTAATGASGTNPVLNARFVAPQTGLYDIQAQCRLPVAASGIASIRFLKNGNDTTFTLPGSEVVVTAANANGVSPVCRTIVRLNAGDYVCALVFVQNTMNATATGQRFVFRYLGPE